MAGEKGGRGQRMYRRLAWNVVELTLHVRLNLGVSELASDQALGVENSVVRVHRDLVLGSISDQALRVSEGDVGGGGAVSLVLEVANRRGGKGSATNQSTNNRNRVITYVSNDLNAVVLPHSNAGVGGSEVNSCREVGRARKAEPRSANDRSNLETNSIF
jgi:hypothetical protein